MDIREWFDLDYRTAGASSQRLYPSEARVRFIKGPEVPPSGCRVLEVGCGNGRNLAMLLLEGFDAIGTESSLAACDIANERLAHFRTRTETHPRVYFGDIVKDVPPSCAVVVDVMTLQHLTVEDLPKALSHLAQSLSVNAPFFSYRLAKYSLQYPLAPVPEIIPIETLESIYSAQGFTIVSTEVESRRRLLSPSGVEYYAITARLSKAAL